LCIDDPILNFLADILDWAGLVLELIEQPIPTGRISLSWIDLRSLRSSLITFRRSLRVEGYSISPDPHEGLPDGLNVAFAVSRDSAATVSLAMLEVMPCAATALTTMELLDGTVVFEMDDRNR